MTENTYQFAARQVPALEKEKAELIDRLAEIEAELKILRPALKAAPQQTGAQQRREPPTERANSGSAAAPEPRNHRSAAAPARDKRAPIIDLGERAPGQDNIIAARIGAAGEAEGSGE